MSDIQVRLMQLEPHIMASFYAYGECPEEACWNALVAWAQPRGLLADPAAHPIYGFNNPNPAPGAAKYGYEFWIAVAPDAVPDGDMRIHQFNGGLYAVARSKGVAAIFETWKKLFAWCTESDYAMGTHQSLEKYIVGMSNPDELELELYLPIVAAP